MSSSEKIAAIRPGEWVSTLSKLAAENGHPVTLYLKDPESLERFKKTHIVDRLPGVKMPENITASSNLDEVLDGAKWVIFGPPSIHYREFAQEVTPKLGSKTEVLSVTKGLEPETSLRMSQVLIGVDPSLEFRSAFLSGPNLAKEVIRRIETVTVIASYDADLEVAEHFKKILGNPRFKVIPNPDVVGVELGGALKNPYSIAAGIEAYFGGRRGVAGNRHSALLTASMAEIIQIGEALGAEPMTLMGNSGLGDLELGFMGKTRNFELGLKLARKISREKILAGGVLYEGLNTLPPLYKLAKEKGIETPILDALYGLVFEKMRIQDAIRLFMDMDVKDEYSGRRSPGFYIARVLLRVRQAIPSIGG